MIYSGTVVVVSKVLEPSILFASIEYGVGYPNVLKASMASIDGSEIISTIELDNVLNPRAFEAMAFELHRKALMRLECFYGFLAEKPILINKNIICKTQSGSCVILAGVGVVATGTVGSASIIVERQASEIKETLERNNALADIYFELFHQARSSSNEVVEFLGYYQLVSSALDDPEQKVIDDFFMEHSNPKPAVTSKPRKNSKLSSTGTETVYTRLRNEIAHVRYVFGTEEMVNLADTKAEISNHVRGLRRLAVIAIDKLVRKAH